MAKSNTLPAPYDRDRDWGGDELYPPGFSPEERAKFIQDHCAEYLRGVVEPSDIQRIMACNAAVYKWNALLAEYSLERDGPNEGLLRESRQQRKALRQEIADLEMTLP